MGIFSSWGSKTERLAVIIDVGSASIGVALALLRKDGKPTIFYTKRKEMPFQSTLHFEKFFAGMGTTLTAVLQDTATQGMLRVPREYARTIPDEVVCVLGAPWHAIATKTITIKRDQPFTVTDEIMEQSLDKEAESFREKAFGKESVTLLEKHVMRAAVNGYPVVSPKGKRGTELSLSLYLSLAPEYVVRIIREGYAHVFHNAPITFHSHLFALFAGVRDLWPQVDDSLLVRMSGEVVEIGLVADGALRDVLSFPMGTNIFVRDVMKAKNISATEARSLLSLVLTGKSSRDVSSGILTLVKNREDVLLRAIRKALASISPVPFLLQGIFVSADPAFAGWLKTILAKEALLGTVFADSGVPVHVLSGEVLAPHIELTNPREDDTFLTTETIFADRAVFLV
ncbi:MAG: hypothetical protein HY455_02820 [Parcubacteria group bacterium]|nr:hypothetical protein [Parcubacteria group bacterium]